MNASYERLQEISLAFDRLCIFGAGGSGREVAWLARQRWGTRADLLFAVDHPRYINGPINGIPVMLLSEIPDPTHTCFLVAVGESKLRKKAAAECELRGMTPARLVHPRVDMSDLVEIGAGTIIGAGCTLTTNIAIGKHVHINIGCTVSHDARIADFATLSPGCHVAGHVHIGTEVFIGTGASIINGSREAPLTIGAGAVIAAGACVIEPVRAGKMVAGVPAMIKR